MLLCLLYCSYHQPYTSSFCVALVVRLMAYITKIFKKFYLDLAKFGVCHIFAIVFRGIFIVTGILRLHFMQWDLIIRKSLTRLFGKYQYQDALLPVTLLFLILNKTDSGKTEFFWLHNVNVYIGKWKYPIYAIMIVHGIGLQLIGCLNLGKYLISDNWQNLSKSLMLDY